LELVDRLRKEFPDLSPHTVVRCVSIVAHHPSAAALNLDALLRHTERIARARLTHLNDLPGQPVGLHPTILTVEDNVVSGGFGSAVSEVLAPLGIPVTALGVPDAFIQQGSQAELFAQLGLDAAGVAASVRRAIIEAEPAGGGQPLGCLYLADATEIGGERHHVATADLGPGSFQFAPYRHGW